MINGEKYRDEILAVTNKHEYFALKEDNPTVITRCNDLEQCRGCLFDNGTCSSKKMKWLLSECKESIKLSKAEYEILKWLEKGGYKFIVRSPSDNLMAHNNAPRKAFNGWVSENDFNGWVSENKYKMLWSFNELFQFVRWENSKPTLIQEVLNNCEVADDA